MNRRGFLGLLGAVIGAGVLGLSAAKPQDTCVQLTAEHPGNDPAEKYRWYGSLTVGDTLKNVRTGEVMLVARIDKFEVVHVKRGDGSESRLYEPQTAKNLASLTGRPIETASYMK